LYRRVDAL
jgi:hypothetical protein